MFRKPNPSQCPAPEEAGEPRSIFDPKTLDLNLPYPQSAAEIPARATQIAAAASTKKPPPDRQKPKPSPPTKRPKTAAAAAAPNPPSLLAPYHQTCELSRDTDRIWVAGDGTNESINSKLKPPSAAGGGDKLPVFSNSADGILRKIIMEPVAAAAEALRDLPSQHLEVLRQHVGDLLVSPEKKDELVNLQRMLEARPDLTVGTLSVCHDAQLQIIVAIKTGTSDFLSGEQSIPATDLVEIFLQMRCWNANCRKLLPTDGCQICSARKGFCGSCMCMVCLRFDSDTKSCSWVGCDDCRHWCHAVCALEVDLISSGGGHGTGGLQFHCLGCGYASKMFGFVEGIFNCCASEWSPDRLKRELDYVLKIFGNGGDGEDRRLHTMAKEILNKLNTRMVHPSGAYRSMLHFFKYGDANAGTSKGAQTTQASRHAEILPPPFATQSTFSFNSVIEATHPSLSTEDYFKTIETISKMKEEEAELFEGWASHARSEAEGFRRIACAKSDVPEDDRMKNVARLWVEGSAQRLGKKLQVLRLLRELWSEF